MKISSPLSLVVAATLVAAPAVATSSDGTASRANNVKAVNFKFTPKTITVGKGDRVTWTATEGSHTITFKSGFDKGISAVGSPVSKKFNARGTFRYYCRFHRESADMKGKVVVG